MASIFTKIINGEIPSYKVYEDEKVYAFLDINPEATGHTLVVPKIEVQRVYDLSDEDWSALWCAAKKIAKHMEEALGLRIMIFVVGKDVPHAHIHLVPAEEGWEFGKTKDMSEIEFEEIRTKLSC